MRTATQESQAKCGEHLERTAKEVLCQLTAATGRRGQHRLGLDSRMRTALRSLCPTALQSSEEAASPLLDTDTSLHIDHPALPLEEEVTPDFVVLEVYHGTVKVGKSESASRTAALPSPAQGE
jgi:hypothetical protein